MHVQSVVATASKQVLCLLSLIATLVASLWTEVCHVAHLLVDVTWQPAERSVLSISETGSINRTVIEWIGTW